MVDAVFAFDGVASAVVGRRVQALLHVFAEHDVLLLDFVAEGDGLLDARASFGLIRVMEKPFKDGEGFVGGERNDDVGGNIVGINVEHQVGKNPEIERLLQSGARRVHTFAGVFLFHGANRRELLGIIAIGVGAIVGVIDFAHQTGMGDGNVVALEIVVDVHLPVAVDDVVAALNGLQSGKLKATRLL